MRTSALQAYAIQQHVGVFYQIFGQANICIVSLLASNRRQDFSEQKLLLY